MSEAPSVRAVIADDEPTAREAIRTLLADVPEVDLVAEAENGIEAVRAIRKEQPDLLLLDVQMPDQDGFGVLQELGDEVPPVVVFVTAHDEHALRAFEVHAVDYLLKPFGRARFRLALDRALAALAAQNAMGLRRTYEALIQGQRTTVANGGELMDGSAEGSTRPVRLGVRIGNRIVVVELDTIDWVEADGDHVRLHVGSEIHLVSRSLRKLATLLDPERFVQIHRSVIVQIDRVRELRREPDGSGVVVLKSGVQLRVARGRWEDVERSLGLAR